MWNWLTTPFIQVTWDGTDEPIRQTTSLAGADEPDAELTTARAAARDARGGSREHDGRADRGR